MGADSHMPRDEQFETIVKTFLVEPRITRGKMFGSSGLKVGNKIFAMLVRGKLVVKLPKERVACLVASGEGERFDPGHGRLMKEWVGIEPQSEARWLDLAHEAIASVERTNVPGKV
jgi:TfoX/Sxy family transcriptional regulator of competence genes